MSYSTNLESVKIVAGTIDESNNTSTFATAETSNTGLFIIPSQGVPARPDDITGYVLTAANEEGKLQWSSPDTGSLPASLQSIASLTTLPNQMLYTTAPDTYAVSSLAVVGRSFLGQTTALLQRQALGLDIGVDVQGYAQQLTDLVSVASTADRLAYTTGGSYSGTVVTAFARSDLLTATSANDLASLLGYITQGGAFTTGRMVRTTGSTEVTQTGITIDGSDNIAGIVNLTATGTINGVTTTELAQIANIDSTTISPTQWGYLGDLDQSLATTDTPTFLGLNSGSQKITNLLDPTNAQDAATKTYVDTVAGTGAPPLTNADYATAAILPNSPVYASPAETLTSTGGPGSLAVDGQTVGVGDRILVKDQADDRENGVYDVTDDGASPGPNWVLTRSSDFNQAAMPVSAGTSIFVSIVSGASNSATTWALQVTVNNVDPLTDSVIWVQTGGIPTFTAGLGIDATQLSGGTIQIENTAQFTYSGNALELSTVTVPYGGTGQVSLTSGGVLVGQGASAVSTAKAAPSGDFVGTSDTQTLTNKTATDNTNNITARSLFSNSGANTVSVFASANPTSGQVLTATGATTATWQNPTGGITTFARTLTVASSNPDVTPNWTTLGAALTDAATLTPTEASQVLILMYPGTYAEATPLSVPAWVTISGQTGSQNTVTIRPSAPAAVGAVMTSSGNVRLFGLVLDGFDGATGYSTIGFSSIVGTAGSQDVLTSVTVRNCSAAGFNCIGDGTQFSRIMILNSCTALVTAGSPFVMTDGYLCSLGGIMSGNILTASGFLSGGGVMTNGFRCINDFSIMEIKNAGISSVVNGINVGTGVTSNNVNDYPQIKIFTSTVGLYSGSGLVANAKCRVYIVHYNLDNNKGIYPSQVQFSSVNPTAPADPNQLVSLGVDNFNNTIVFSGDLTNFPDVVLQAYDYPPGLEQQIFTSKAFGIGTFVNPAVVNLAQGSNHINGMVLFRDDGGIPTNINPELALITVSPFECDLASTGAIDLASAPATVDGVAPSAGVSRILVKDGSTANPGTTSVDNGIYLWNGTGVAMTRTADFAAASTQYYETYFAIDAGTVNYDSRWQIDATTFVGNRITVGTTAWGVAAYSAQLFPAAPANDDALYIGSAAVVQFPGIELRLTAALTTSSGTSVDAIVWEYFNGAVWVEQTLMSTLTGSPYTIYANETMAYGTTPTTYTSSNFNYRFGDISAWVPTTVFGVFGYWIRCRVIDSSIITQVPVAELLQFHTSRVTIGGVGFMEYFGTARVAKKMTFMSTNGNVTSYAAPQNEVMIAADDGTDTIQQTFIDCQFNNGTEAGLGWTISLPAEIDTSFPITMKVYFMQASAGAGDVALRFDYVQTATGSQIGAVGTPTTTLFTTGYTAHAVGGSAGEQAIGTLTLPIETLLVDNRLFWFQIRRDGADVLDTFAGNLFIPVVELQYCAWCDGRFTL